MNLYGESTTGEPEAPSCAGMRWVRRLISGATPAWTAAGRFSWLATATTPTRRRSRGCRWCSADRRARRLAVVTSMVWQGGDWKYVFPPGGMPSYLVLADLTGYVPWTAF